MDLTEYLIECFLYVLPVLTAGLFFILTYKKSFFCFLNFPVSQNWFGRNKTWRGFVLMPVYCSLFVLLASKFFPAQNEIYAADNLLRSLLLGLSYPLGELPNSFVKRRLGIPPGGHPTKKNRFAVFFALDNIDSVVACCICLAFVYRINPVYLPGILVLGSLFHLSTDALMVRLELKPPRSGR